MSSTAPLQGLRVLLTRPHPHNEGLRIQLEAAGAQVMVLPLLDIVALPETPALRQQWLNLDQYQVVIAVSPNAARFALEGLDAYWPQWPLGVDWLAVGQGSAKVLRDAGLNVQVPSQGHDSEALLQLPRLQQVAGERILILRGREGRELLGDSLRQRGARVEYAELYERAAPQVTAEQLAQLQTFDPHVVLLFSGETLAHYLDMGQTHGMDLQPVQHWLPSERAAQLARERGLTALRVMQDLQDPAIVQALSEWHHPDQ